MSFSYKGTAPTIATVISQAAGTSVNGFVKKNAGYYVYANVTDNSGTGIQSVTANVANVTTGCPRCPDCGVVHGPRRRQLQLPQCAAHFQRQPG